MQRWFSPGILYKDLNKILSKGGEKKIGQEGSLEGSASQIDVCETGVPGQKREVDGPPESRTPAIMAMSVQNNWGDKKQTLMSEGV